ncbi:MAG: hypothetical protein OXF20_15870 [Gammaproteobacteria bacterium]|nr:hypothetical protein [Gammaproteobacteria bacterium]
MNCAHQIIEAFKNSSVERILVVDDAYDVPEIAPECIGELLVILEDDSNKKLFSDGGIEAATNALKENNLEHESVSEAVYRLYEAYLDSRNPSLDPNGLFKSVKGSAVESLDPLLDLLCRCTENDSSKIETVGTDDRAKKVCRNLKPDLIFMDFYLDSSGGNGEMVDPMKQSTELLKQILLEETDTHPAVILMSSKEVENRQGDYFKNLEGRVMALHYGYLSKEWVSGSGQDLTAMELAADVLIDISGSLQFGRNLEGSLQKWRTGTEAALQKILRELREFDIKDFAHLLRFRLHDEERFADYLEWFLGESLRVAVDEEVEWGDRSFSQLDDRNSTDAIEGSRGYPSERLAKSFHRIRFNSRKKRIRHRFALGDVFLSDNNVRMVITPDCDLVPRGGKSRPSVNHILTIGGEVKALESHSSAEQMIFHNGPKTIKWKKKDLMTHKLEVEAELKVIKIGLAEYGFFASMHPTYAQIIQKSVLAELSRIGTFVPPTVDVTAPVKVFVRTKGGKYDEPNLPEMNAQVFMPRGGHDDRLRALFSQRFVRVLLAMIDELEENDLEDIDRESKQKFISQASEIKKHMLNKGLRLGEYFKLSNKNIFKASIGEIQAEKAGWLEIVVDVNNEALFHSGDEGASDHEGEA